MGSYGIWFLWRDKQNVKNHVDPKVSSENVDFRMKFHVSLTVVVEGRMLFRDSLEVFPKA